MTLEGLSSVGAKLELASFKNNEILEINVLQKFISHALYKRSGYSVVCLDLKALKLIVFWLVIQLDLFPS